MQCIMLRGLLAVQPVMINDRHCFELYGEKKKKKKKNVFL
jgi:hypothetical protein